MVRELQKHIELFLMKYVVKMEMFAKKLGQNGLSDYLQLWKVWSKEFGSITYFRYKNKICIHPAKHTAKNFALLQKFGVPGKCFI
jgi:hypothetical protein